LEPVSRLFLEKSVDTIKDMPVFTDLERLVLMGSHAVSQDFLRRPWTIIAP